MERPEVITIEPKFSLILEDGHISAGGIFKAEVLYIAVKVGVNSYPGT